MRWPSPVASAPYGTTEAWLEPSGRGTRPSVQKYCAMYVSSETWQSSSERSTWAPCPVRSRRNSAPATANAPSMPPARSPIGSPMRTGGPPSSPVTDMAPPIACSARSNAGQSRYGPSWPYAEIEHMTSRGLTAANAAYASPSRSMTPGRKFSHTTSASRARSRNTSRPSGFVRSSARDFLLRLIARK